jgi:hypothetical protein
MALKYHPDRGGSHEQMILINEAWFILSDPTRRKIYDNSQIYTGDIILQREASVNRENAQKEAQDYPRTWSSFQEWMEEAFKRVEEVKLAPFLLIPNPQKDILGWIFVIAGGSLATYLSFQMGFTRSGSFYTLLHFLIFSIGAWLGWVVYQYLLYQDYNPGEAKTSEKKFADKNNSEKTASSFNNKTPDDDNDKKNKIVIKCEHCKDLIRVPNDRGLIDIRCPHCCGRFRWSPDTTNTKKKCPNCGYVRQEKDDKYGIVPSTVCPKCGVIYKKAEKYLKEKDSKKKERK